MTEREHEIVLFGATGFTGALTAEYLAKGAAADTRWSLAGRNRSKLERLRDRLAAIDPRLAELPLLHADSSDPASLQAVAASTKVLVTTVGPYLKYGEPLVAACAAAGTAYLDLTGEPEFVDRMWLAHHEQAKRTGARIVHACGFDSIPYDLGVLYTVGHMPEGVPLAVRGFIRAGGTFSGGTYHSAIGIFSRLRQGAAVARERRGLESRPHGRAVKGVATAPYREPAVGGWVAPLPTLDPQIVLRTARALERYGPDFSYGHYAVLGRLPVLVGAGLGAGVVIAAAQLRPTRNLLLKLRDPGEGPSPEQRAKGWFKVTFTARTPGAPPITTQVSGGDPGYGETARMLGESALCLAKDELPDVAGQTTTAVAMGQRLIDRLVAAGIVFRVVS
jgi:short subunit dehydrogenase-like uncharacterized protein